jgi:hypothetical protein
LGVSGPSCGIPGPWGPLYAVGLSAAGNSAPAGKATESAALVQIPFIRLLLDKSELINTSPR